jgi:hypothetical protein
MNKTAPVRIRHEQKMRDVYIQLKKEYNKDDNLDNRSDTELMRWYL